VAKQGPREKIEPTKPLGGRATPTTKRVKPKAPKPPKPVDPAEFPERLYCKECGKDIAVVWTGTKSPSCPIHKRNPEAVRWTCTSSGSHPDRPFHEVVCKKCRGYAARQAFVDGLGWFGPKPDQQELNLESRSVEIPVAPTAPIKQKTPARKANDSIAEKPKPAQKGVKSPAGGVKGGKGTGEPQPNLESMTPLSRQRGLKHVIARCQACGFEAVDRLEEFRNRLDGAIPNILPENCPVCTSPMRWWCTEHSQQHGWLEGPICSQCASAPFDFVEFMPSPSGVDAGYGPAIGETRPPVRMAEPMGPLRSLDPAEEPVIRTHYGNTPGRSGSAVGDRFLLHGPAASGPFDGEGRDDSHPGATRLLMAALAMTPGAALAFGGAAPWLAIPAALAGPLALHAVRGQQDVTVALGLILGFVGFWILSRTALIIALVLLLLGGGGLLVRDRRIPAFLALMLVLFLLFRNQLPPELGGYVPPPSTRSDNPDEQR
jgi:hypothetical protein